VSRERPRANGDFEALVRGRYASLSPSHRRIADHLLADLRRAALEPIANVAKDLDTSESTVVRFAQSLGYPGYPELREQLRERFLMTATSLDRLAASASERGSAQASVLERVLAEDADAVLGTLAQIPHRTFDSVVEAILAARRTYVVGMRGSAGLALVLGMGLRIFLPETRVIAVNVGDTAEELLSLRKGDVVILISVLRYAGQTLEILRYARAAKARTVAITDSPVSPIAREADHVLLVRPTAPRSMASYAAIASLASALTEAVAARKGKSAARSLRDAEALWERFRVHAREGRPG
jgi:DNA-binding MurR/RpiR family transcriptional regulator